MPVYNQHYQYQSASPYYQYYGQGPQPQPPQPPQQQYHQVLQAPPVYQQPQQSQQQVYVQNEKELTDPISLPPPTPSISQEVDCEKKKTSSWFFYLLIAVVVLVVIWLYYANQEKPPAPCGCPAGLTPYFVYTLSQPDSDPSAKANLFCSDPQASSVCNETCISTGLGVGGFAPSQNLRTCLPALNAAFYTDANALDITTYPNIALTYDQSGNVTILGSDAQFSSSPGVACWCYATINPLAGVYTVGPNDCNQPYCGACFTA